MCEADLLIALPSNIEFRRLCRRQSLDMVITGYSLMEISRVSFGMICSETQRGPGDYMQLCQRAFYVWNYVRYQIDLLGQIMIMGYLLYVQYSK
jgi:hypothetical protein